MKHNKKIPLKRIVALRSARNNDLLDYYLTLPNKSTTILRDYDILWAILSPSHSPGPELSYSPKSAYQKVNEIGSGGFSKVYKGKISYLRMV